MWSRHLTALNQLLADLFDEPDQTKRVAAAAGIPRSFVGIRPRAIDTWYHVLVEADRREKVSDIIRAALNDYPDHPLLLEALDGSLIPEPAQTGELAALAGDVADEDRIRAEALMGAQSTLLPISFLARGQTAARAVALIEGPNESGTGFLTNGNILVTNNHVLPTPADAIAARVIFGFEQSAGEGRAHGETVTLRPDDFFLTSPRSRHDWTLVSLADDMEARYGALALHRVDHGPVKYVNIIQHPLGAPKQIALYHNVMLRYDEKLVHYLTDTNFGASGAPVFDSKWQVVALHRGHMSATDRRFGRGTIRNVGTNINLIVDRVV